MSPLSFHPALGHTRFPRVSGDEPARLIIGEIALVFSPRERG